MANSPIRRPRTALATARKTDIGKVARAIAS
jgi:hypothetical protein